MTVTPLVAEPWSADTAPPGVTSHPARLGELLPAASRTDDELAAELQRVIQVESMLAAYKAELVTAFAARRPMTLDRSQEEPGAASPRWAPAPGQEPPSGVSEFFADELALVLNCSRVGATTLTEHSMTLVNRLPATWAALADGELDWPRARGLAEELGWPARDTDPRIVAEVEAAVLPTATRMSIKGLRTAARRELLRRDAAAADRRRERAERLADVTSRPARDGMGELTAFMPHPLVAACRETVDVYARMAKEDGDSRPIGQLRAAALADLILRPWDTSRPPVTAHLTVITPLVGLVERPSRAFGVEHTPTGNRRTAADRQVDREVDGGVDGGVDTADVEGQPITAAHVRALLEQLDALCPGGLQAPTGGTLRIAIVDPVTGKLRATTGRPELERIARRGCSEHGSPRTCSCPVLDRPPPVDRYTPTPAQRRFVTTRDRTCRHPGCHGRSGWADLDHVVSHAAAGPTDCANLCCLCRRHHRLKTHAAGWLFAMTDDGVLSVTTPSGVTRITSPPWLDVDGLPDHVLPPGPVGAPPGDDPPPF